MRPRDKPGMTTPRSRSKGKIRSVSTNQDNNNNTNAAKMVVKCLSAVPALPRDGSMKAEPTMDVDHVAKAVLQMAELPLDANVQFMTIMASSMPVYGRG